MRIAKIIQDDLANGPGLRTSVFVSGCEHHCEGCHAEGLWPFELGHEFTEETIKQIIELLTDHGIDRGLSILGGEPLHDRNIEGVTALCKAVKEALPRTAIWLWTGFQLHEKNFCDIINYVDVVVDGKFIKSLADSRLKWRGSANQQIYYIVQGGIEGGITRTADESTILQCEQRLT